MAGELTMKDMEVEDLRKTVAKRANVVQELAESKKAVVFFKDKVIDANATASRRGETRRNCKM